MMDDPHFASAPAFGKLAIGGRWEQAVVFRPSDLTSPDQVHPLLEGSEEVACEAFFGSAFFGVRLTAGDLATFVVAFAHAMGVARDGRDFLTAMAGLGILLEDEFQFAELGAEGAWNSIGALRISDPCAARGDSDALWREVMSSPVGRDTEHDKALEFTYAGGATHWFAVPVSVAGAVSRPALESALDAFCRTAVTGPRPQGPRSS